MDYFMTFHWWYLLVAVIGLFIIFGKSKGGVVATRLVAKLDILDERFSGCQPEADYSIFKGDSPDHIDIEIERLSIPIGDELEFVLNGKVFATVVVERDKEAEFDHWADEDIEFPEVKRGDELLIRYQGTDVLKGRFNIGA